MQLGAILGRIAAMVTRAKIAGPARDGARLLVQITGLDNEVFSGVELVLPYGMSANPPLGADVVLLQANGQRDHKLALCADHTGVRIKGLAAGEFGFSDGASVIVFKSDGLHVSSTRPITLETTGDNDLTLQSGRHITLDAPQGVTVTGGAVQLGGTDGRRVVLDGDKTSDGATVIAGSANTYAS